MMNRLCGLFLALGLVLPGLAWQGEPVIRIEDGVDDPVSVVLPDGSKQVWVVNRGGGGFVTVMNRKPGRQPSQRLVQGLPGAAGAAFHNGTLYVVTAESIAVIDVASGDKEMWPVSGSSLSGIAVDDRGQVYVSDTTANRIVRIKNGGSETFASGNMLHQPNGLLCAFDQLYMACQGGTQAKGAIRVMPLQVGADTDLWSEPLGRLNDLAGDGDYGFYVSDTSAGLVYHVSEEGRHRVIVRTASPRGIGFDKGANQLWVATPEGVLVYRIKP